MAAPEIRIEQDKNKHNISKLWLKTFHYSQSYSLCLLNDKMFWFDFKIAEPDVTF
jgi:hypothetical protein